MAKMYSVSVSISDGVNTMTVSSGPKLIGIENLKDIITDILTNNKDGILNNFPANQWIYQWIISSNIDGTLESFFTAFGVTGNENLMNALLGGSSIVDLGAGDYVLSFEGY